MRPLCPAPLTASPFTFAAYLGLNVGAISQAQVPENPTYDEATHSTLRDDFQNFSAPEKP
jgi:hypothetical protein